MIGSLGWMGWNWPWTTPGAHVAPQEQIFQCAKDLEALNVTDAPIGGRWSLVSWWQRSAASDERGFQRRNPAILMSTLDLVFRCSGYSLNFQQCCFISLEAAFDSFRFSPRKPVAMRKRRDKNHLSAMDSMDSMQSVVPLFRRPSSVPSRPGCSSAWSSDVVSTAFM